MTPTTPQPNQSTPYPKGISESEILDWANRILENRFQRSHYLSNPGVTREYLRSTLAHEKREVFALVFLDNQHAVMGLEILFYGTIDGASVYPREVVKAALDYNAAAVILAHNHPSGMAEPSAADQRITERIIEALNTVDIRVLDHLIIGGTNSVSFAERGLI
jgi:DNA repair protein RadC